MKITVAGFSGFCPGVRHAVDTVKRLSANRASAEHIYTLGKLIHNTHVIEELSRGGVTVISEDELDDIYKSSSPECINTVAVRAHGITEELSERLDGYAAENDYFKVIDCTCVYVRKIHEIVDHETAGGAALLVIGDGNHPEVRGIVSRAHSDYIVADSLNKLVLCNMPNKPLIMVAQTTFNLSEWKKCQEFVKNHCTNAKIFDTICGVTEKRQKEADALSKRVDLMYIIGSTDSSNTAKLYAVSKSNLANSHMIEDASGIDMSLVRRAGSIGITAGASTPGDIIEEVETTMSEEFKLSGENFEEMLEGSLKTLNTGDIVTGVITSISSTEIHVDLSANVTGILPVSEIVMDASAKVDDKYKVGDEITAYVVRVSDIEGVAGLSRRRVERITDWKTVTDAKESGEILEGTVSEIIKGGVMITYNALKLFVPASQTGVAKDENMNVLLGTTVKFEIIEIDTARNRAVASIRNVQRKERKEAAAKIWDTLEVGQKFTGTVKSIVNFGVFVDLGGVDGMVHITELTWKRIKNPSEVVSVGDTLDVYVKSFDPEKKKISLGCKTEESHPWNYFMATYKEGDVASVKVVNLTPFGAFAEITPEVDGLIHISQIADKRIASPAEVLHIGDVVDAKITAIDTEKKKVSLSIRALIAPEAGENDDGSDDGDVIVASSDDPA